MKRTEHDFVERFLAAFNSIDRHLRARLDVSREASLSAILREYCKRNRYWGAEDDIRRFADLRNLIVHEKVRAHEHFAIPSEAVVDRIEAINNELSKPETAFQRFKRTVEILQVDCSLAEVFKRIHEREYSQFPLYSGSTFVGLLTENGITRWLAHHVTTELSLVDLDEVKAAVVIRKEESKRNCAFVARDDPVWEIRSMFGDNPGLEATLVTQTGKTTESLLGIATRWDMLQFN